MEWKKERFRKMREDFKYWWDKEEGWLGGNPRTRSWWEKDPQQERRLKRMEARGDNWPA